MLTQIGQFIKDIYTTKGLEKSKRTRIVKLNRFNLLTIVSSTTLTSQIRQQKYPPSDSVKLLLILSKPVCNLQASSQSALVLTVKPHLRLSITAFSNACPLEKLAQWLYREPATIPSK